MSTGSLSDAEDFPEVEMLACGGGGGLTMDRCCSPGLPPPLRGGASHESHDEDDGSVGKGGGGGGGGGGGRRGVERSSPGRRGRGGVGGSGRGASLAPGGARKKAPKKGCPLSGVAAGAGEGKQVQRHAANARERARMRVLSKAFSRLKTTLPWVPPDTKLSKLDTLRLASSYIAHLRQILASDKFENGYIHPVNLTWPFMVAGKPENELKEAVNATRLCGPTAS